MGISAVTIAVVTIYLAATFYIGWRGRTLASQGDMFNLFGRRAGTVRAASGYLSLIGGGELITICQLGYDNGIDVFAFLGGIAAGFLFLALFSERVRLIAAKRGVTTFAGYFNDQYGLSASIAITIVFLLSLGSLLSIQFIVGSQLINAITGVPQELAALVMGAIILAYLLAAGYVAVLSTDILRAVFMSVVLLVITGFLFFNFDHLPSDTAFTPLSNQDRVTFFLLGMFAVICAGDVWQTVFASQNRSVASRSLLAGAACFLVFGGLIAFIGVATKGALPTLGPDAPALIEATRSVIPGVLSPLMGLLIVGSVMATADTEIWVISTSLLSSKLPSEARYRAEAGSGSAFHSRLAKLTRFVLPIVTAMALLLAYLTRDAQALYQGMLVQLIAIAPVVFLAMFITLSRVSVALGLWFGLCCFVALFVAYRAEIPADLTFVPPAISLAGVVIGEMISRFARPVRT